LCRENYRRDGIVRVEAVSDENHAGTETAVTRQASKRKANVVGEARRGPAAHLRHGRGREDKRSQQCEGRERSRRLAHKLVRFSGTWKLEVDAAVVVLLRRSGEVEIGESNFLAMPAG
jgi:hypothetical protein